MDGKSHIERTAQLEKESEFLLQEVTRLRAAIDDLRDEINNDIARIRSQNHVFLMTLMGTLLTTIVSLITVIIQGLLGKL